MKVYNRGMAPCGPWGASCPSRRVPASSSLGLFDTLTAPPLSGPGLQMRTHDTDTTKATALAAADHRPDNYSFCAMTDFSTHGNVMCLTAPDNSQSAGKGASRNDHLSNLQRLCTAWQGTPGTMGGVVLCNCFVDGQRLRDHVGWVICGGRQQHCVACLSDLPKSAQVLHGHKRSQSLLGLSQFLNF